MKPHDWRLSRRVVDPHNVEPHRTFLYMAFAQKSVSRAHQHLVFLPAQAQFRQHDLSFHGRARPHLHKRQYAPDQ
ncbi:MAG TPA: hypothetical protein VG075_02680 [Candidatus Acidoferrum sp.]|jgi:hypothetical protein|nr:hypothetical protein [Candidatus Acidoferrum sp.]